MHAAAVADGRIYVAGGFDGIRDLAAAEMYDPRPGVKGPVWHGIACTSAGLRAPKRNLVT